jgi:formate hydrogenlyase subunit 3/multisubunit Na+/H+ antiporter MnhD subunit
VIVGSLNNLNQKKIKKILGLSSLFSLGWVLLSINKRNIWIVFILGYSLILWSLLIFIKRLNFYNNENLENLNFTIIFYLLFFLGLLIIRGIPPFIIFYIKILILIELIQFSLVIVFILLLARVLIIYIYLIIGFRLLTFLKNKFFIKNLFLYNTYILNYIFYNFLIRIFLVSIL